MNTENSNNRNNSNKSTISHEAEKEEKVMTPETSKKEIAEVSAKMQEPAKKESMEEKENKTMNSKNNQEKLHGQDHERRKEKREVTEKRTRHTRTFENGDHTMTTRIFFDPVHYQDEDGTWKEMDDRLVLEEPEEMEEDSNVSSGEKPGQGEPTNGTSGKPDTGTAAGSVKKQGFMNKKGSFHARFSGRADARTMASLTKDAHCISWGIEGAAEVEAVMQGEDKLLYPEVLPCMNAQYRVTGEKVKENVIVKDPENVPESISFLYHTGGLEAVQDGNKVVFQDEEAKEIFSFAAPFMQDASGAQCEKIGVSLEKIPPDDGNASWADWRITILPDQEWLKAEERSYPVIIDPVITTSQDVNDIIDAHVDNKNHAQNYRTAQYLYISGGNNIKRSFLKFTLPEIETGDMIVGAKLYLVSLATNGTDRSVEVHKVLQDWDSATLTWDNRPLYDETVEDIIKYTGNAQKYITLDVTKMVKGWYMDGDNYGVMLKDPYELSGSTQLLSSDVSEGYSGLRPHIDITYLNCSGLESYWSYHTQDVGRAGTVHVNDYSGNLILVHDTLSMGGSLMPVNLKHVYNTNDRASEIGYGYGFRLNYHQKITPKTIGTTSYYEHVDGDGTRCYFVQKDGAWKDETGKELTLTISSSSSTEKYVIKDKEENQLIFNSAGYLVKMKDKNGNALSITWSSTNRITKLTDGAGRETTLSYYSSTDRLSKVTSPSGQVKKFTYDEGILTTITDVDDEVITYGYNNKILKTVKNIDGYEMRYTYLSGNPKRVKTIKEYAGNNAGNSLKLSYGHNSTKFTDGKDRVEIFRFNNWGNLLHIHDGFGHAAGGTYSADRENHANCLENTTRLQSNVLQLLADPLVQAEPCGWKSYAAEGSTAVREINTAAAHVKAGTRSLKVSNTAVTGTGYWY